MNRQPTRRAVVAVRTVKAGVTAAVAGTAIVVTLGGAIANPGDETPSASESSVRLAEGADVDAHCVGAEGRAIVRSASGETRTVPFRRGWQIYRGERPGTLLAVCPD